MIKQFVSEAELKKIDFKEQLDTIRKEYQADIKVFNKELKCKENQIVELQEKLILKPPNEYSHIQTQTLCCKFKTTESQTDHHPDMPYKITDPLPPIFTKILRHKT